MGENEKKKVNDVAPFGTYHKISIVRFTLIYLFTYFLFRIIYMNYVFLLRHELVFAEDVVIVMPMEHERLMVDSCLVYVMMPIHFDLVAMIDVFDD